MAIAYDATGGPAGGTGNFSWTHTPVGTPRGVVVYVIQDASGTDLVTSVTYGGVAMTEVALSPVTKTTGEVGVLYAYHIGTGILTGARAVQVTASGGGILRGVSFSVTAAADTEVDDTSSLSSDSAANPNVDLTTTADTFVSGALLSGRAAVTDVTEAAGFTNAHEHDFGSTIGAVQRRDAIASAGTINVGWTAIADDAIVLAVAIKESGAAAPEFSGWGVPV